VRYDTTCCTNNDSYGIYESKRTSKQKLYSHFWSYWSFVCYFRNTRVRCNWNTTQNTLFCLGNYNKSSKLKCWPESFQTDLITWMIQDVISAKTYFLLLPHFFLILLIHYGKTRWKKLNLWNCEYDFLFWSFPGFMYIIRIIFHIKLNYPTYKILFIPSRGVWSWDEVVPFQEQKKLAFSGHVNYDQSQTFETQFFSAREMERNNLLESGDNCNNFKECKDQLKSISINMNQGKSRRIWEIRIN
jgi:hypothetical protein